MGIGDWTYIIAAALTAALLVGAGISDLTRYRISNKITDSIAILFAIGALAHLSWIAIGWAVAAGVAMLLLGALFFALGLFGGGDTKLIASTALWVGMLDLPRFVIVMSAAGGILGVVWFIRRLRYQRQFATALKALPADAPKPEARKFKLPYGVAIALAGLDFFLMSQFSPFAHFIPWELQAPLFMQAAG